MTVATISGSALYHKRASSNSHFIVAQALPGTNPAEAAWPIGGLLERNRDADARPGPQVGI